MKTPVTNRLGDSSRENEARSRSSLRTRIALIVILVFPMLVIGVIAVLPFFVEGFIARQAFLREWKEGGSWRRQSLPQTGGRIRGDDRLVFEIEGREPVFLYAFAVDSAGNQRRLFPDSTTGSANPLPPEAAHVFPGGEAARRRGWLWDFEGKNIFYFIYMSRARIPSAESIAVRLTTPWTPTARPIAGPGGESRTPLQAIQTHMSMAKKLGKQEGIAVRRYVLRRFEE